MQTVYIVLPAYNEEKSLPRLLDGIMSVASDAGLRCRVVIVDDGSADGTVGVAEEFAKKMDITLIRHPQNRGLARTLDTGLRGAVELASADDVIITMDADDTQPPELIPSMLAMLRDGRDVVVASRYRRGAGVTGVPLYRRFLSYGASWMFRLILPVKGVRDYTSGYRAYRAGIIKSMYDTYGDAFISEQGFSCMVDVLLKLRGRGLKFGEVPLLLRYDRKAGASKMRVASTVMDTFKLILRRRFGR